MLICNRARSSKYRDRAKTEQIFRYRLEDCNVGTFHLARANQNAIAEVKVSPRRYPLSASHCNLLSRMSTKGKCGGITNYNLGVPPIGACRSLGTCAPLFCNYLKSIGLKKLRFRRYLVIFLFEEFELDFTSTEMSTRIASLNMSRSPFVCFEKNFPLVIVGGKKKFSKEFNRSAR